MWWLPLRGMRPVASKICLSNWIVRDKKCILGLSDDFSRPICEKDNDIRKRERENFQQKKWFWRELSRRKKRGKNSCVDLFVEKLLRIPPICVVAYSWYHWPTLSRSKNLIASYILIRCGGRTYTITADKYVDTFLILITVWKSYEIFDKFDLLLCILFFTILQNIL